MVDQTASQNHVYTASSGSGRSYIAAQRHSARVKRLKVVLPVAALVISLAFIAVSVIRSWVPEELSIESATVENGKIVMMKPAVAGRNDDGIAYSMNADRALQDIAQPNMMTLENINAAVPSGDIIARVLAKEGIFDRNTNKLEMTKPFEINLSNGIQARFQSADVDLRGGTLVSREPIAIDTKEGSIVAKSLQIADNGKSITFSGNVHARFAASTIKNTGQ